MPPFGHLTEEQKIAIASYVLDIESRQKEKNTLFRKQMKICLHILKALTGWRVVSF
jgi:hypothetical protein